MDYRRLLNFLPKAKELVRGGYNYSKFIDTFGLSNELAELLYSIALANIRYSDKFSRDVMIDLDSARLATHEIVADYHARRLRSRSIADLGCGVGIQLAFFAKYSDYAFGVELDRMRAEFARINVELYGVSKKAKVINGNVFDSEIIKDLREVEIIFSDPARPYHEPIRTLDSCTPNPQKIFSVYSSFVSKFAFDLPPQIRRDRVSLHKTQEFEYISLNGDLNRLTLYLGELARSERSAVVLPSEATIVYDPSIDRQLTQSSLGHYLYDVDGAVVAADLVPELIIQTGAEFFSRDRRRVFLTSREKLTSHFFKGIYEVFGLYDKIQLHSALKHGGFGRVVIRYPISSSRYYAEKRKFEHGLLGDKTAYIFHHQGKYVLATKSN